MKELVELFLVSLQSRKHLLQLLSSKEMTLQLDTGAENVYLEIKEGNISIDWEVGNGKSLIHLKGHQDGLSELLTGKSKLRELIKLDHLKINTTFRNLLLLESLFYLNK